MVQKIVDILYRNPKSQWNMWQKFGGYFPYKRMINWENEMKIKSSSIQVNAPKGDLPNLKVSFLTGKKYWHQTVFCAYSLQLYSDFPIQFLFYDDGSFTPELIQTYKKQIPNSIFITQVEIEDRLSKSLPKQKYPFLHHKREVYKHIRKLTDVYAGEDGWKLMLDSDMLFMRRPDILLEWLSDPHNPIYIVDSETSYGYSLAEMSKLSGTKVKERVNVGLLGLHSKMIDFDKLEYWVKTLEGKFGTSYYLEQALSAMIIGDQECVVGPPEDYIVYPNQAQVEMKQGVLHHYVDLSKKWYFGTSWRSI